MTETNALSPAADEPEAEALPEAVAAPRDRRGLIVAAALAAIVALDVAAVVGVPAAWSALPPPERPAEMAVRLRRPLPANPIELPPPSDPEALLQITAEDAAARNAAIPVSAGPNPAAEAFRLSTDEISRMRSIDCLTAAVYYESGFESTDGQRAVAQVVLNRVRHAAYPNTVCGVVFQGSQRRTGCQFTFTCDGALGRTPNPQAWDRSRRVAEAALSGYVYAPVGWATHYHANYVFPYWAPTLTKVAEIGAHIFYRWGPGGRLPGAFSERYAGGEPNVNWRSGTAVMASSTGVPGVPADPRDAAAAEAAREAQAAAGHSVDSFQSAVLRRYEPVNQDNAQRIIRERVQQQAQAAPAGAAPVSESNRWALTGQGSSRPQAPLGRADAAPVPPTELGGVRRRPGSAPVAETPAAPTER